EYSINASTGGLTKVSGSPLATRTSPESVAVDPAGRFVYATNVTAKNQVTAYSITPSTGSLTLSGSPIAAGTFPIDIVIDPSGLFAYAADDNSNDISVYAVDPTTGVLTVAGHSPFAAGNEPRSIAID
ncbi:MAG: lactonase family protein, partial [Gammaproteobacteria bacterium]